MDQRYRVVIAAAVGNYDRELLENDDIVWNPEQLFYKDSDFPHHLHHEGFVQRTRMTHVGSMADVPASAVMPIEDDVDIAKNIRIINAVTVFDHIDLTTSYEEYGFKRVRPPILHVPGAPDLTSGGTHVIGIIRCDEIESAAPLYYYRPHNLHHIEVRTKFDPVLEEHMGGEGMITGNAVIPTDKGMLQILNIEVGFDYYCGLVRKEKKCESAGVANIRGFKLEVPAPAPPRLRVVNSAF